MTWPGGTDWPGVSVTKRLPDSRSCTVPPSTRRSLPDRNNSLSVGTGRDGRKPWPAQRSTSVPLVLSRSITASRQFEGATSSYRISRCILLTRRTASRWAVDRDRSDIPGWNGSVAMDRSTPLIVEPRPTITGTSASSGNRMSSACVARSATTISWICWRGPISASCMSHEGHMASPSAETSGQTSNCPCQWAACGQDVFSHFHRVCRMRRCSGFFGSSLVRLRSLRSRAIETSCAAAAVMPSKLMRTSPSTVSQPWNRRGDRSIQGCWCR